MKVVSTIEEVRRLVGRARSAGKSVGFVPTLGALHEAHLSLIDAAQAACKYVVVSIFVNPTQFGPEEDLERYPRSPEADAAACRKRRVDLVFLPSAETMYPQEALTRVTVPKLSKTLCGRSRPWHFPGVCVVCAKLFEIVRPDKAFFGDKDFQQAVIVARMVRDLNMPVEIVRCPTVREPDGLAMSSRNAYLSSAERKQAAALHASLQQAAGMIRQAPRPAAEVAAAVRQHLAEHAPDGQMDYVELVDPVELQEVDVAAPPVLVALAVKFSRARLIDNVLVDAPHGGR